MPGSQMLREDGRPSHGLIARASARSQIGPLHNRLRHNSGIDPKDLRTVIAETSDAVRNLLIVMIAVSVCVLAGVFSASDEALLIGSAEPIPGVGIRLSLKYPYVIVPILYLALHLALLAQFDLLCARV